MVYKTLLWIVYDSFISYDDLQKVMKEEALRALGLTDKEIRVYLANLRLGASLVQNIAKTAGLNRTSCYDLFQSLEQKGFVSYTLKSGKRYYQATHPNKLHDLIKEKENLVKKALPELNSLFKTISRTPNVEVYTGKEGIKSIFEDVLRESKSLLCMCSNKDISNLYKYYMPHFVERRKKKGIKVKLVLDRKPIDKDAEYKIVKNKFKTMMWIYGDKIALISPEEDKAIGIMINEKNFAQTFRLMFDIMWKNL